MRQATRRRLETAERAAVDKSPYAEVDCDITITLTFDDRCPETWECHNVKTGEPVAVTPELKRAIRKREAAHKGPYPGITPVTVTPTSIIVDWSQETEAKA